MIKKIQRFVVAKAKNQNFETKPKTWDEKMLQRSEESKK